MQKEKIAAIRELFADFRFAGFEEVERSGEGISFKAWCSLPHLLDCDLVALVNGRTFPVVSERMPTAPDPQYFAFWPDRPTYSLRGSVDLASLEPGGRGFPVILTDSDGCRYFPPSQDFYIPPYWDECLDWDTPSLDSIGRVTPWLAQRTEEAASPFVRTGFLLTGYSDIWHIDDVLAKTGRSIGDMRAVLDWAADAAV